MSSTVIIKDAVKQYGEFRAVNGVNLSIKEGEFFTLLGPSGCGKTTLLRMIAGFNSIDGGEIRFGDRLINQVEAHKRDIGMVFQNYAIFPHMTVKENVAYGLKAKKIPKPEIWEKVLKALEQVQIENLAERKPNELSGGQQQRVALARAFVIEPGLLLMDEPLSNLDAKLRVQMRTVIKQLQRRLGITTIYVTHDQEEALAISDRIAVMNAGDIMQVGTPKEIYSKPQNTFVAGFIGVSNFISVDVDSDAAGIATLKRGDAVFQMSLRAPFSGKAKLSVRPEQFKFTDDGIRGVVQLSTFLGDFFEYEVKLEDGQIVQVNEYSIDGLEIRPEGEAVCLSFRAESASLYDEGGEVLSC